MKDQASRVCGMFYFLVWRRTFQPAYSPMLMRTPSAILLFCRLAGFLLPMLSAEFATAQVYGCKDPAATNYNANATVNDGSCQYTVTPYTPPTRPGGLSPALNETSGLQWAGNHLWSFNDGGNDPVLFRIDTASDAVLQTVILEGATNVDWEDIGFDGTSFYIGDFGNNYGDRTDLKIYKINLSDIPDYPGNAVVTIPAGKIRTLTFTYADQNPVLKTDLNKTKYDCEAMLVDGAKIHLFTKNWLQDSTTHYVLADTAAGHYTAARLEAMPVSYRVTAADKAHGSDVVMLLGYQPNFPGNHFLHVLSDYSGGYYFNGNKRRIDLSNAGYMGQAEGITFRTGTYGYISSEKIVTQVFGFDVTINQKLFSFNTLNFTAAAVLPVTLEQFAVKTIAGTQQLEWRFSAAVPELTVEVAENGATFRTLATYPRTKSGTHPVSPAAGTAKYRLRWKDERGKTHFSKTILVRGGTTGHLANFVLSAGGQLAVVNQGSEALDYRLKVLSVDGRTLALESRKLHPGLNQISFAKSFTRHSVLLLQLSNEKEEIIQKLWVR